MLLTLTEFLFFSGVIVYLILMYKNGLSHRPLHIFFPGILILFLFIALRSISHQLDPVVSEIATASLAVVTWGVTFKMMRNMIDRNRFNILSEYNHVANKTADCVVITDSEGSIVFADKKAEDLFRYAEGELQGRNIKDIFSPANDDQKSRFLTYNENDTTRPSSIVGYSKDDKELSLFIKIHALATTFGRFKVYFVHETPPDFKTNGTRDDVLRSCFYDFAPVIFVTLDEGGSVLTINEHGASVLKLRKEDVIGKMWVDNFIPSENGDACLHKMRECLDSGDEKYFRAVICDSEGCDRLIQWKCGSVSLHDTQLILLSGEDITQREEEHEQLVNSLQKLQSLTEDLEQRVKSRTNDLENINTNLELHLHERDQIEQQLVNSERLHRAMAHNFPNGIIAVIDRDLNFLMVDGKELEQFGRSHEELTGKNIFDSEFGFVNEDASAFLYRTFEGETTFFEVTHKGRIYNVVAVPLPDQYEHIEEILVVIHNVTESKKLEERLYATIEKEKKLNELKSRFVTMASHEFRTPLSTILSSIFLMESYSGELYEEKKHIHINRIKRTVNMLTETLNDFLRLGKLEEGRIEIILTETSIADHVNEILKEINPLLKHGQIIRYESSGVNFNVMIDKNIVRGILVNLLSNAIKYSPEKAEIIVASNLSESELILAVSDQGIGIAPEEQEHIFQRFFRAMNAVHIEGSGLGLHIVKRYVELMNGTIDFKSGAEGTTFTVNIPLRFTHDNTRLILQ